MRSPLRTLSFAALLAAAACVLPASASAYVYWSNGGGTPTIGRANTDGSSANQSFLSSLTGVPRFMDLSGDWIYWGTTTSPANGVIGRAKVSGATPAPEFMTFSNSYPKPGVSVDSTYVYWTDQTTIGTGNSGPKIQRVALSNVAVSRASIATWSTVQTTYPTDLTNDGTYLYWAKGGSIYRAAKGTTNQSNVAAWVSPSGATEIEGVAQDASYVYFADRSNARIGRIAKSDGSVDPNFVTNLSTGIPSSSTPVIYGLEVDGSYIYWTDTANDVIGRAPIGGSSAPSGNFISGANDPYGVAVGGPYGVLSPSTYSFGSQLVSAGAGSAQTFTLTSSGASALTIDSSGISLTGADSSQFAVTGGTCSAGSTSLANGQSCTVTVNFDPSSTGAKSSTLQIATNDGIKSSSLSGQGTSPAGSLSPSSHDFGSQALSAGASSNSTFTLSSSGSANLSIESGGISLSGSDSGQFVITGGTCSAGSSSLVNGESCTVAVAFDPSSLGSKSATLEITTNDGTKTAALSGKGWDGNYIFFTQDAVSAGYGNLDLGRALSNGDNLNQTFGAGLGGNAGLMAGGENQVFWGTEPPYAAGNTRIGRAVIDGSSVNGDWKTFGTSAQDRRSVAVFGRDLFWLNRASSAIGRYDLKSGSYAGNHVTSIGDYGAGIAADSSGIYWSANSNEIWHANLDGSGAAKWVTVPSAGFIEGLATDSGYLYFADRPNARIGRVTKSDGSVSVDFVTHLDNGGIVGATPHGVAVTSSYIYWADPANDTIGRAPIGGSSAPDGTFLSGLSDPIGVAVATPAPDLTALQSGIGFGDTDILDSAPVERDLTFTSSGLKPVTLGTPSLSGNDSTDFSVISDNCASATLQPGGTCTVRIGFDPQTVGSKSALISLGSDSSNSPEVAGLAGTGIDLAAPTLSLTAKPPKQTKSRTASFRFVADQGTASFECRIDGRAWGACASPKTFKGLRIGSHLFSVRAIVGPRTGEVADYRWKIVKAGNGR